MSLEQDHTWSNEEVSALLERPLAEVAPTCKIDYWLNTNSLWIKPASRIPWYAEILYAIKRNPDSETTTLFFSDAEGCLFSLEGEFEIMHDNIPSPSDIVEEEGIRSDQNFTRKIHSDFSVPIYSTTKAPYQPF